MTVIKGSWQGFVVSGFLQSISKRSLTLITVGKSADEILVPRRVKFEFLVSEIYVVQQMMENTQCQDSECMERTIRLTFTVNKDISVPDGSHTPLIMVPLNLQLIIIISEVLWTTQLLFGLVFCWWEAHMVRLKFSSAYINVDHKKLMVLFDLFKKKMF